jgi:hypothetical protein
MIIMPDQYEYLSEDYMQRTGASQNVKMLICVCVRFQGLRFVWSGSIRLYASELPRHYLSNTHIIESAERGFLGR